MQPDIERAFSEMTYAERTSMVDSIHINYPAFTELLSIIRDYHLDNKTVEPDCLFIGANTGTGKSTLKQEYMLQYPRQITDETTIVKVLSASIPPKATILGTAGNLLKDLGDPSYDKGSIDSKSARLWKYLIDCKVELIILDEVNHLCDRDSQKQLKLVADWMKALVVDNNVPIVALGLKEAASVFNPQINPQLSRRFMERLSLEPLTWDVADANSIIKFLYAVEEKLPLMKPSNLFQEDMALRFLYATDGSIAHIMTLIRQGVRIALKSNKEFIDMSFLATVFDKRISNDKPHKKINPFRDTLSNVQKEYDDEIALKEKENLLQSKDEIAGNKATNNRIKGGKKKALGISDVF